jgi:hypothetical protein
MATKFPTTVEQIRLELKSQLGDRLEDLIEALMDEKIRRGIDTSEQKFLVYLAKKKDI